MRTPARLPLATFALALAACATGPEPVSEAPGELTVCGHGPTVEGIDVSEWQGNIDWNAVAGSGVRFAIVRISDGTYRDRTFAANWNGAQAAGLLRGAYQFFEPGVDPDVQADIVIAAVGVLGPNDMPVTLDVEAPSPSVGPAEYTARIHRWVERVTNGTGRPPMIYTGRYYWDPYVASSDFAGLPLWHAQYTSAPCPNINDRWSDWTFWQYTSTGSVPGIGGNVDRNVFNGTFEQLQALAHSDQLPTGWIDAAACDGIRGWALDPDFGGAIDVHLYVGGPAGDPAAVGFPIHANVHRDDVGDHGFSMPVPYGLMDGVARPVFAYGIGAAGGGNALLMGSPATLECARPAAPFAPAVRRHVVDPDSYAAWHFAGLDVVHVDDATLAGWAESDPWPRAPMLFAVSGDPAVYVADVRGGRATRRHVPSPEAMDAWRLDWGAIAGVDATTRDGYAGDADLAARPYLVQGSGPAVYVLDAPPPAAPMPDPDADAGTPVIGADAGMPLVPRADASSAYPDGGASPMRGGGATLAGGCSVLPGRGAMQASTLGLALAALVLARRMARRVSTRASR
ncbi:MAG: glycoside hydrolase family 25 protein [Sandaracinus sp.]